MARVPAYERIREALRVEADQLGPGGRLPGENALAERFGVTRVTVRHAIAGLAADGVVVREHGRGTFVLDGSRATRRLSRLTSLSEDLRGQGLNVETTILSRETTDASTEIAEGLDLGHGARVVCLERLRVSNGKPIAIQKAWVPVGICPSLAWEELENGSLYETLERRHGIRLKRAEQWMGAVAATREQAVLLGVRPGSPLLHTKRITVDDSGKRTEFALSWMRPEYQLSALLER